MACGKDCEKSAKVSSTRMLILGGMLAVLSACLFNEDREARGSVVENEIVGIIKTADGAPSVGARVQLYPADIRDGLQKTAVSEATTNIKGEYRFPKIKAGLYSLLGQHDTLLVFHDSIQVSGSTGTLNTVQTLSPDTLRATGAITVQVILRPGDDPATISGVVQGTAFGSRAQSNGDVSMAGMPSGRLRLRFSSSLPGYTPLDVTVDVTPGKTSAAGVLVLPF